MSQVRKLLQGAVIKAEDGAKPKQPKGGKYWKNGLYVAEGEDVYRQLAEYLAGKEFDNVRDFANDFLKWYGEGNDFSSSGVYHNYSPTFKPEGWGKNGSYIGKSAGKLANTDKSRFYTFGQQLNAFNYVAPKEEKIEEPEKKSFDTSEITLDYNQTTDKKKYKWSDTALDNEKAVKRVLAAIEALKDPDNSGYKLSDDLRAWYNIKGDKNLEYANAMWDDLRSDNWDKSTNLGAYEDWLAPLGIKLFKAPSIEGDPKPKGGSGGAGGGNSKYIIGQIYTRTDGTKAKYLGDDKWEAVVDSEDVQEQEVPTETGIVSYGKIDSEKPTLKTRYDENGNLQFYINYQGKDYLYNDLNKDSPLYNRMQEVSKINKEQLSQSERIKKLQKLLNIPDNLLYKDWELGNNYVGIDSFHDTMINNGFVSAAVSDISDLYNLPEGHHVIKFYDNYSPGTDENFNFRAPYYLYTDPTDGSLKVSSMPPPDATFEPGTGKRKAPTFQEIPFNPNGVAPGYRSDNKIRKYAYNEPATELYKNNDIGIYRKPDGSFYVYYKDPIYGYYEGSGIPGADLKKIRKLLQNLKKQKDSFFNGGKIDSKKINTLIAKHGAKVVKAQTPAKGTFDINFNSSLGYDVNQHWNDWYNNNFPGVQVDYGIRKPNLDLPWWSDPTDPIGSFEAKPLEYEHVYTTKKATAETEKPEKESAEQPEMPYGGDVVDPYAGVRGAMMFGSDALGFITSLLGSKMKRDNNIKMAKDSVISPSSSYFHGYSTAMPVEEQHTAYLRGLISQDPYEEMAISDPIQRAAIKQNRFAQLLPELDKVSRRESEKYSAIEQANVGVADKQNLADTERVNKLKDLQRAAIGMIGSAKDQHIEEVFKSLENLRLQQRQKLQSANDAITKAETARDSGSFINQQNEEKKKVYTDLGVTDAYNNAKDRTSYLDEEDWLWSSNSDEAKAFRVRLESKKKQWDRELENKMAALALRSGIDPMYRGLIPAELKKSGGKVRNRYKNEPWEDIWIYQNKATHAQVARLSDNIIKLFLKTLK